jgi:hypothetical protein
MNARLRLAPFFVKAWGTARFPTPLHGHGLESGP